MAGSNITVPESLMAELEKAAKSEQRSTDAVAHEAIERSRSWNRHAARLRAPGSAGDCRGKRWHECQRGTQECVRHKGKAWTN
jgi:hypothetical protein